MTTLTPRLILTCLTLTAAASYSPAAFAQTQAPAQTGAKPPAQTDSKSPDGTVSSVVVNGARAAVETTVDRRSYSVANDLQGQTGSLADVLRDIPSVQVDLQGVVSLRGDPNVTVLVDGKPSSQFSGQSLAQMLQSMPAGEVDRIEVITNPSAEFRADGKGGIINLIMKKAKGAGSRAQLRVQAATEQGATVSGNAGYNSNKVSTVADFSYHQDHQVPVTDNQQTLVSPAAGVEDLDRGHLAEYITSGHVGSDYDLSAKTRLSGGLRLTYQHARLLSVDQFDQDDSSGAPLSAFSRQTRQHGTQYNVDPSIVLRHTWSEGRDLALNGAYDNMQYKRDRLDLEMPTLPAGPDSTAAFDRHTHYNRWAFMADYETPLPGGAKLKLGYDFEYVDTVFEHFAAVGAPGAVMIADPRQTGEFVDHDTHNQAYVTYERTFGKLDVLTGLRGDALHIVLDPDVPNGLPSQEYDRLYPSLHLGYALADGRTLTASYSRRVDRPGYGQLDPIPYAQNPGFSSEGNPSLKPQDTDSFELGLGSSKDASSLLATLYYRRTTDAFSAIYSIQSDGGLLQQTVNAGNLQNGGLELVLANKLTPKLTYNLSADAYWTELSATNLGLAQARQALTGFGRANLNWQLTPKDFLQLNVFVNGKTLLPQGYVQPFVSGNIGYRHVVSSKVSWMFVVQDPLDTARTTEVLNSVAGRDRQTVTNHSRTALLSLSWNFSGKPAATDFDFKAGGYGGTSPP